MENQNTTDPLVADIIRELGKKNITAFAGFPPETEMAAIREKRWNHDRERIERREKQNAERLKKMVSAVKQVTGGGI